MRTPRTHMGRLLEAAYGFYADPANIAAFEEWRSKGKPPIVRQDKRMDGSMERTADGARLRLTVPV